MSRRRHRRSRRGRFLRRFLSVLMSVAVAAVAIVLIGGFALSALGMARFVPVLSNSMAPDMPVGSMAIALPVAREAVQEGDVVIFTAPLGPDRRVIHRVINVVVGEEADTIVDYSPNKLYMETKGDNNPSADPWIVTISDDQLWRQSSVVQYLGWPAIWLNNPQTRFVALGAAGLALVVWALVVVWRRPPENVSDE